MSLELEKKSLEYLENHLLPHMDLNLGHIYFGRVKEPKCFKEHFSHLSFSHQLFPKISVTDLTRILPFYQSKSSFLIPNFVMNLKPF